MLPDHGGRHALHPCSEHRQTLRIHPSTSDDSSIPDEGGWSGVGGTYDTIRYDYYYYYYYLFFKPTGTKPQAIIILIPVLNSQGMKNTLHNTKKYKNQAGMNLTPPPPSQNSHAVTWHCTSESERSVIIY